MVDTQSVKKRVDYNLWTKEESGILLNLMVDAANKGWCDKRGALSRQIVDRKILPYINSKFGGNKNYNHYQSRLKSLKNRWLSYSSLLAFNSDFKYDSTKKRFTAPNEVWDEYLKAHPKDGKLYSMVLDDYEYLEIIFRNDVGLGGATEAQALETNEGGDMRIDDLNDDIDSMGFVPNNIDSPLVGAPEVLEVSKKNLLTKRGRKEYEGSSNSIESTLRGLSDQITKLTTTFEGIHELLEKRENERNYTTWDAIKEVPDLDEDIRFEAFDLLNTETKKDGFLKMTSEERAKWILNMMRKNDTY